MYRAAALLARRSGVRFDDGPAVSGLMALHEISVRGGRATLDGEDVSAEIREPWAGDAASIVSTFSEVRRAMVALQRRFADSASTVAEGRDMGTVVFPGALLKVYIVADLAIRAVRRCRDTAPGAVPDVAAQAEALLRRDRRDRERPDSPLRPAPGAWWLDTTLLGIREQVDMVVAEYRRRRAELG